MSTTIEKSPEQLKREVEALQAQAKRDQQDKLLQEQNDWFFQLIDATGKKAIEKAKVKLKTAEDALKLAQTELQNVQASLMMHGDEPPFGSDKKATKAWKKQLDTLKKGEKSWTEQIKSRQAAVIAAADKLDVKTVEGEKTGLRSELSGDTTTQEKVLVHAKYEPLYDHRKERLDDLIKQLEAYLPATVSLVDTFSGKRTTAADALKADPKPWKTAYELLPQTKEVNQALAQMDTIWDEALAKNVREVPAVALLADNIAKLRTKLSDRSVAGTMSDDELTAFRSRLDDLEKPLHKPLGPNENVTPVTVELDKLDKEVARAALGATGRKSAVHDKLRRAKALVADLAQLGSEGANYPISDKAVYERQVAIIETTCRSREYDDAGDMLDQLLPSMEQSKQTVTDGFTRTKQTWEDRKQLVAGMLLELTNGAQLLQGALAIGGPQELVERAKKLSKRLKELQTQTPGIKPTYAQAIASTQTAEAELLAFKTAVAGVASFPEDLARAKQQVADAAAEATTAITELERTLQAQFTTGTPPDLAPTLQPLKDKLGELGTAWEKRVSTATNLAELSVDTTCAEYVQLKQKATDAGTTGLPAAKETILLAPARKDYARAKLLAEQVAHNSMASDPVKAVELLNMIDAAHKVATAAIDPKDIEAQTRLLTKLVDDNAEAANRASDIALITSGELEKKLKEVKSLLAELLTEINKISTGEVQKPYATLHTTFATRADEFSALVGSKLLKMLEAAVVEVEALKSEIATAQLAIANEKGRFSKARPSFGAIKSELAGLTERLGSDTVKLYAISSAADLGEQITTLSKGLGEKSLAGTEKELVALTKAVKEAEEKAKTAKGLVAEFEKLVDKEKKVLEAEPFTSVAANLAKSYKGRFEALKGDATYEDGLEGAKTKLAALKEEIKGVLESPKNDVGIPILVFSGEEDALEAKRKAEQDKGRFAGEVKVLKKQLEAAKKGGIDPREIDGLEEALKSAEKAAEKSGGSYADAREQVDGIQKRLSLLETNPQGLIISSRNQLPGCNKFLKGEIKRFTAQTKELGGAIATKGLDDPGKKTVATALGAIRGLFNPAALDPFLPIVASKDPSVDRKKRAAARESALREVRRMMGYIDGDFRLMALSNNPFDDKMAGIISGLKLALLDIENNLLVSLPG